MKLITFPARPTDGGSLEDARRKFGKWDYEPKWNGWRGLAYLPELRLWNRHGKPCSIESEFRDSLAYLAESIGGLADWADVELLDRRHGLMRGGIMLLDIIVPGTYMQRRELLEETWPAIFNPFEPEDVEKAKDPERLHVYLTPSFSEAQWRKCHLFKQMFHCPPMALWGRLISLNDELTPDWRRRPLNCFTEGVVAKKRDSTYPTQLLSDTKPFGAWMKHRFV